MLACDENKLIISSMWIFYIASKSTGQSLVSENIQRFVELKQQVGKAVIDVLATMQIHNYTEFSIQKNELIVSK